MTLPVTVVPGTGTDDPTHPLLELLAQITTIVAIAGGTLSHAEAIALIEAALDDFAALVDRHLRRKRDAS